jgi:hypothetical protein
MGRAATTAILHTFSNMSLAGLRATRLPCNNRFDCSHRICLAARSVENVILNAAPNGLRFSPLKCTYIKLEAINMKCGITYMSVDARIIVIVHVSMLPKVFDRFSKRSDDVFSQNLVMSTDILLLRGPRSLDYILGQFWVIYGVVLVIIPVLLLYPLLSTFVILGHNLGLRGNFWQVSPLLIMILLCPCLTNVGVEDFPRSRIVHFDVVCFQIRSKDSCGVLYPSIG